MKMTTEECEDIAAKIDSEGFDYYFTAYGPDRKLLQLIPMEISAYQLAKRELLEKLFDVGIEIEP